MHTPEQLSDQIFRMVSEAREKRRLDMLKATGGNDTPAALIDLLQRRNQEFMLQFVPPGMTPIEFAFTVGTEPRDISEHGARVKQCERCPRGGGACDGYEGRPEHVGKRVVYSEELGIHYQDCDRWTEYRLRQRLGQYGVPANLRHVTLQPSARDANYGLSPYIPDHPTQKTALSECIDTMQLTEPYQLLLTGPSGTGKTHLACAVVRELTRTHRMRAIHFAYVPELTHQLSYDRGFEARDELLRLTQNIDLLVLDDLGAGRIGDFERDMLMLILHQRHANGRSSIITTNESLERLGDLIGPRLVSRLEQSTRIMVDGKDYRAKES